AMGRFRDHPFVRTVLAVQRRYGGDDGSYLAASIAHYGFLSLFPLLLLGLAAVGFVLAGDAAAQREWARTLSGSVPGLGPLIGGNLDRIVSARGTATAIGALALLWSGTRITEAASRGMNIIWRRPREESFIKKKAWSLAATIGLGTLALVGFAAAGYAGGFEGEGPVALAITLGGALLAFAVDFTLFLIAYRVLVKREGPPFPRLWPGALFASAGWTILKLGGSWLASTQVDKASAVYGTFAVTIGILVLLTIAAHVFLYGAELNVVLKERSGGDEVKDERFASAPENGHTDYGDMSTGQLVRSIATDTATLVRKEVELAKQEVTEGVTGKLKGAAGFIVAGVVALIGVVFLGAAMARALDLVMPSWASRLIVAALFLLIGGLAAAWGRSSMKGGSVTAEETRRTVKEDVEWARDQLKR
ncbi:MAG TPA: YhjD/YihY/BrkB family envelope integrity protein, partial [Actinomycetota bacterium]|nr:YhjD/YihY/BrkB family envelope integrity protein [Actinomycetota bacterium]